MSCTLLGPKLGQIQDNGLYVNINKKFNFINYKDSNKNLLKCAISILKKIFCISNTVFFEKTLMELVSNTYLII